MDEEQSEHQKALMAALDFTEDDLVANRSGAFSDWQQHKSHVEAEKVKRMGGIFLVTGIFLAVITLPILWAGVSEIDLGTILVVGIVILVLGGGGYLIMSRSRSSNPQVQVPVAMAEGLVRVRIHSDSYDTFDEIFVGDSGVKLWTHKSGSAFRQDEKYRVYFQPFLNEVLSAEWVGRESKD